MIESRLNKLGIKFPFMVGPMVGISHVAFRELVRSYVPVGIDALVFTEMLSSRRLPSERLDSAEALKFAPNEKFLVPQLLGNEEKFIAPSIKKLMGCSPWGIDINMGCPVSHMLKHNWGVMLMGDKNYAARVVEMTKRHTSLPVSVKMRSSTGHENSFEYLNDFTHSLENAGADWITLHCRTKAQGHKGKAQWDIVGEIAKKRNIPVVANGDIQTAKDALSVITQYHADGAMIGRAATARPWILWQIASQLGYSMGPKGRETESPPLSPESEGQEYFRALLKLIDLLQLHFGDEPYALRKLRFFIANSYHWFFFGHHFWKATMKATNLISARELILSYCSHHSLPMLSRIEFK